MMRCLLVLTLGTAASLSAFSAACPFKSGDRIAFLGDSITQLASERDDGWVKLVERDLRKKVGGLSFVEAGISGNTSRDMAARFDTDVLARKPNWMFFSCGVNDTPNPAADNPGYPLDQYKARVGEIFDKCAANGIRVICLTATPVCEAPDYRANEILRDYNAALKAIAAARNYPVIDIWQAFDTRYAAKEDKSQRTYTEDGTHLNRIGHTVFAETLLASFGIGLKKEAVVIVGAHPDDIGICLGFCHLARDLYEIHDVVFTHGERGCGPEKFKSGWTKATRTKEEEAVCASIGAKLHWLDEIDGEAYACRDTTERLAALLREIKPRAVIGHWPVDIHTDHVMSGAATLRAVFLSDTKPEVWFMGQIYQSKRFTPDVLVDVSSVWNKLFASLSLYACQSYDGEMEACHKMGYTYYGRQSREYYQGRCEGYKAMILPMAGDRNIFSDLPRPKGNRRGFEFEGAR